MSFILIAYQLSVVTELHSGSYFECNGLSLKIRNFKRVSQFNYLGSIITNEKNIEVGININT